MRVQNATTLEWYNDDDPLETGHYPYPGDRTDPWSSTSNNQNGILREYIPPPIPDMYSTITNTQNIMGLCGVVEHQLRESQNYIMLVNTRNSLLEMEIKRLHNELSKKDRAIENLVKNQAQTAEGF